MLSGLSPASAKARRRAAMRAAMTSRMRAALTLALPAEVPLTSSSEARGRAGGALPPPKET